MVRRRRILVIKNDPAVRWMMVALLSKAGHHVDAAGSASEGIAAARKFRPDLVLVDLNLPGVDGATVARLLKEDPELGGIPVVLVSGASPAALRAFGARRGVEGFMEKPFGKRDLFAFVEK